MEDTYKDIFNRQWCTLKGWKKIHKNNRMFDDEKFFMFDDVQYICKKAQADAYKDMIDKFKGTPYESVIPDLELEIEKIWGGGIIDN